MHKKNSLKNILADTFNMVAKTQQGLEPLLAEEIKNLGATNIEEHKRAVSFDGNKEILYKANLHLRTALRILIPIKKFSALNEQQLYDGVKEINWENYMRVNDTLAIEGSANSDFFNHTKYISLKSKDAIVDQFREKYDVRPSIDIDKPTLRLNIHIFQSEVTVALDSSNESLHRRGYRADAAIAPLNEVTAAALVMQSGWNGEGNFIDPMCGSGTILIEAALWARNIPPNINREFFGFMNWSDFDAVLWEKIKAEAIANIKPSKANFIGNDSVFKAIEIGRSNATKAGLKDEIKFLNKRFEEQKAVEGGGVVIMNPPYGERLEMDDINPFYKMIGDKLKQEFTGYDVWILSANREALKHLGLSTSKRLIVWNGQLECKFHKYEMYKGTRKIEKIKEDPAVN